MLEERSFRIHLQNGQLIAVLNNGRKKRPSCNGIQCIELLKTWNYISDLSKAMILYHKSHLLKKKIDMHQLSCIALRFIC